MPDAEPKPMSNIILTRRELARQAAAGAIGALLAAGLPAQAQVVDPQPAIPPPLPASPESQAPSPMPSTTLTEGDLLTQLVPVSVGYALSETQTKEVALQLKDYPGDFAKARAYALPDAVGPAFAADAPVRKERVK